MFFMQPIFLILLFFTCMSCNIFVSMGVLSHGTAQFIYIIMFIFIIIIKQIIEHIYIKKMLLDEYSFKEEFIYAVYWITYNILLAFIIYDIFLSGQPIGEHIWEFVFLATQLIAMYLYLQTHMTSVFIVGSVISVCITVAVKIIESL